ncbi:hypothetical protein Pmani_031142 [Petrolisthes manimaculis]|uniref:Chaperone DnaJ C-terminal domain-containing protein n=1 Tax=Petrolisthes manimaculis TaxID=1843537 RepID=A0AAE1TV66_9EUCA|nr:hypothetical protein Pmani_031142 [Petrolisthes manimaculis]
MGKNYYNVLGVSKDATLEDITKAYPTISLLEALCGTKLKVPTLGEESKEVLINYTNSGVIKPDTIVRLKEHGLPSSKNSRIIGDIIVTIKIQFPDTCKHKVLHMTIIQIAQNFATIKIDPVRNIQFI